MSHERSTSQIDGAGSAEGSTGRQKQDPQVDQSAGREADFSAAEMLIKMLI